MQPVMSSPCALKGSMKREEGSKAQEGGLASDQLVPDYAARPVRPVLLYVSCCFDRSLLAPCFICVVVLVFHHQDEARNVSNGQPQTLPLPSENGIFSFVCASPLALLG